MLKGIHLSLMVGPAVPVPARYEVIEALTSVEVDVRSKGEAIWQLIRTVHAGGHIENPGNVLDIILQRERQGGGSRGHPRSLSGLAGSASRPRELAARSELRSPTASAPLRGRSS